MTAASVRRRSEAGEVAGGEKGWARRERRAGQCSAAPVLRRSVALTRTNADAARTARRVLRLCRVNQARLDVTVGCARKVRTTGQSGRSGRGPGNLKRPDEASASAPRQREEGLLNVDVALGRSLEEAEAELVGELLALLLGDDLCEVTAAQKVNRLERLQAPDWPVRRQPYAPSCRSSRTCCQ